MVDKIMVESQNAETNVQNNNKQGSQQLVGSGSGWCWWGRKGKKFNKVGETKRGIFLGLHNFCMLSHIS